MTEPKSPHPIDIHVGMRLRAARKLKEMSQETAAKAVDLTFQQIQKYENGKNRVSASRLVQFSALLEHPIEWFFAGAPGYGGGQPSTDISANFFALPYARALAIDYIAIAHNVDRDVVRSVTHALAGRNGHAAS